MDERIDNGDEISVTTYIAGPMSGYFRFNYHAFKDAAAQLRSQGVEVLSPTEHTGDEPPPGYSAEYPYSYYLRRSLRMLLDCNEIVLLPGWQKSRGACLEVEIAKALDMPITEWSDTK